MQKNNLYWSAAATFSGDSQVIWAKFNTFMNHIINTHSSQNESLFNKCGHGEIRPGKWLHASMLLVKKNNTSLASLDIVSEKLKIVIRV